MSADIKNREWYIADPQFSPAPEGTYDYFSGLLDKNNSALLVVTQENNGRVLIVDRDTDCYEGNCITVSLNQRILKGVDRFLRGDALISQSFHVTPENKIEGILSRTSITPIRDEQAYGHLNFDKKFRAEKAISMAHGVAEKGKVGTKLNQEDREEWFHGKLRLPEDMYPYSL